MVNPCPTYKNGTDIIISLFCKLYILKIIMLSSIIAIICQKRTYINIYNLNGEFLTQVANKLYLYSGCSNFIIIKAKSC